MSKSASDYRPRAYSYVRMSTPEQRKGDSLRRQRDVSARYAAQHGLRIIEGDEAYEDIGVSAFHGRNVKAGALGRFLEGVRAKKIPRGSYLLVESLDRLSRQSPYDAAETMRDIVRERINVVDLSDDERLYNEKVLRTDSQTYMRMVVRFERAHEESKIKSKRVKQAWSNKRASARVHKMTKWCPAWLELSKDRTRYCVITKFAETVRWIFNESAEGRGIDAITRRLNKKNIPHFGKSRGWHTSYVNKILKNKAAIGIYEPTKVDGRLASERDILELAIPDYYPPVISNELFYRVQKGLAERRNTGAGRKGPNYTNLFTGMKITCAYCRGNVRFENKGYGPKGGQYLVCEGSRRGLTCEAQRWRYQHFEESFLSFMHHEIDFASLRGGQQSERRQTLDRAIEAARGSLSELTIQREKRLNLIDKFDEPEFVVRAVEKTTSEIKQVEETLINLQLERDAVDSEIASLNDGPTRLKELIEILNDSHADIYALRSQLARTIKGVISEIILAPFGEPSGPKSQGTAGPSERFDSLEWAKDDSERLESAILLARILNLRTDARGYYAVRLLNGTLFVDVPPENPLDHPLALEKTNALVVLHKDGFFEIREENAPEVISNADTDHGLAVGIGVVTSNVRTGTCQT